MEKVTLSKLLLNSGAIEYVPDRLFSGYGRLEPTLPSALLEEDRSRARWEKAEQKQRRREARNRKLQSR